MVPGQLFASNRDAAQYEAGVYIDLKGSPGYQFGEVRSERREQSGDYRSGVTIPGPTKTATV